MLSAINLAMGNTKIDKGWFDALAATTAEAEASFNMFAAHEKLNKSMGHVE